MLLLHPLLVAASATAKVVVVIASSAAVSSIFVASGPVAVSIVRIVASKFF